MNDELRLPAGAHEDALRWLNRALDGEISERERILLDDHLSGCPPCSTVASQLRAASSVLRADARSHPPVGLVDRILARIARSGEPAAPLAETGSSSRGLAVVRPLRWSAALAAGLLLCEIGRAHV